MLECFTVKRKESENPPLKSSEQVRLLPSGRKSQDASRLNIKQNRALVDFEPQRPKKQLAADLLPVALLRPPHYIKDNKAWENRPMVSSAHPSRVFGLHRVCRPGKVQGLLSTRAPQSPRNWNPSRHQTRTRAWNPCCR